MAFHATRQMKIIGLGIAAVACAASLNHTAQAQVPDLEFNMAINNGTPIDFYPIGTPNGNGGFVWAGSYTASEWGMQFNITGDPDPMVNSFIALQNNSLVTNTYIIIVILPTIAIPGSSLMDGSVGGSVTDANGNGSATAAAIAGSSIYRGLIDSVGAAGAALLPFPYSASPVFSGGTAAIGPASFGQPVPIGGPAVTTNIGIRLEFSLTPGDSIALTSFFRVDPVPAPAGLALLGLAGLAGRSRRRRS